MYPVRECVREQLSSTTEAAVFMNRIINENSTVEEFEKERGSLKLRFGYQLKESGGGITALDKAAEVGNIVLMRHIIEEGKKENQNLLENGSWGNGVTPLFWAAYNKDKDKGFQASKELLQQGAYVNLATKHYFAETGRGGTEGGSTPLWAACEKAKNLKLAKLLLQRGGELGLNPLSEEGKKIFDKAQEKLTQERTFLAGWFKQPDNKNSLVRKLPKELVEVILDYARAEPQ